MKNVYGYLGNLGRFPLNTSMIMAIFLTNRINSYFVMILQHKSGRIHNVLGLYPVHEEPTSTAIIRDKVWFVFWINISVTLWWTQMTSMSLICIHAYGHRLQLDRQSHKNAFFLLYLQFQTVSLSYVVVHNT